MRKLLLLVLLVVLGACTPKWEYTTETWFTSLATFDSTANPLGAEGWELVQCMESQTRYGNVVPLCYFKRRR